MIDPVDSGVSPDPKCATCNDKRRIRKPSELGPGMHVNTFSYIDCPDCGGVSPDPTVPEIEAALEAATPGPWQQHARFINRDGKPVATADAYGRNEHEAVLDAILIANAPRYLAFLLERVKELEAGAAMRDWVPRSRLRLVEEEADAIAGAWRARAVAAETLLREALADEEANNLTDWIYRVQALLASVPSPPKE